MTTINDTYINAFLADSSYVIGLLKDMTGAGLLDKLSLRMTPELAKYISDNFKVVTVYNAADGGFNSVVWQGVPSSIFAGQTFVSIRGTQEGQDFRDDGDLALKFQKKTVSGQYCSWIHQSKIGVNNLIFRSAA